MITIGNVVDVCSVLSETSSKLTIIIGEHVELRLVKPTLPGIEYNQQVIVAMDREIMIHKIINSVCEQFMTSIAGLRGPETRQTICSARKIAATLLTRFVVDMDDNQVSSILNMDRTTAIYNRNRAADMLNNDDKLRAQYYFTLKRLKKALANG